MGCFVVTRQWDAFFCRNNIFCDFLLIAFLIFNTSIGFLGHGSVNSVTNLVVSNPPRSRRQNHGQVDLVVTSSKFCISSKASYLVNRQLSFYQKSNFAIGQMHLGDLNDSFVSKQHDFYGLNIWA